MPTVDGSRNLLTAGANYNAGDWASVGAEASLDFQATANLNRGVDVALGIEAMARLDGAIRQYLAADVNGQASAAARVRAQVQMPLDLFDEAGIAVRLQAVAEAAAGVQLGIGLKIGDFLALAGTDPRLRGAPIELLKIFLDEFTIQGGVMAKAAAAAMAYANLVATGSFIKSGSRQPGFTIAAEAGVGLKAGAGFRVFARFGVDDPRRLVRRTIDVAVDETLAAVAANLPKELHPLLAEAAVPMKTAMRSAFELGAALAENRGAFAAGDRGKLALRIVQVSLEEIQRFILERAVEFATQQVHIALRDLPFDNRAWTGAQAQRRALANRLRALPAEPFEATNANRDYWRDVVNDVANLAAALTGNTPPPRELRRPLAIVWTGVQLLMKSVERISVGQARVSALGASPAAATTAFDGTLPPAPSPVLDEVNATLNQSGTSVSQKDAIAYLLRVIGNELHDISPAAANLLPLVTGKANAPMSELLSTVFSNLGAFVPGPNGRPNAEASLAVVREGLRAYINGRLDTELKPHIDAATANAPEIRIYLDEVLVSTLRTVVDTVFDAVLDWQNGSSDKHRALREMCSSLLMRLFGRSLVVTGDVLLAHALGGIQSELRSLAASVNQPGGIVPVLAGVTRLDRALLADVVTETLEVCADTFGPMAPDRRARMRDLMYQMMDTMPPDANASTLDGLKAAGMVGNAEAAFELAQLLGEEISGNLIRFIEGLLTRVAAALLALLQDAIADIQDAVDAWMQEMEDMARELMARLADLIREIGELQQALDDAVDEVLEQASAMLGGFVEQSGSRGALRDKVKDLVAERALDGLSRVPGYGILPGDVRRGIRRTVRQVVDRALDDDIFDPIVDALAAVSAETAELLDDLRAIEPGDDLAVAIADAALDRIESALRRAFGSDPSLRVAFDAPILGRVDLGRIRVPMRTFTAFARNAVRDLDRFNDAVAGAMGPLRALLEAESKLQAAESEHAAASAVKAEADARIGETRDGRLDLRILEPLPGSALRGRVTLRLRIPGGTPALLSGEGLSHRRLFVWVNQQALAIDGARVSFEEAGERAAHPLARARAERKDALRMERLPIARAAAGPLSARSIRPQVGAAAVDRFGGAALAPAIARGSVAPAPAGGEQRDLFVTLTIPASMLHEGINAIACVLAPGPAARRIERSISFLHAPREAPKSAASAMPARPAGPPVPPELSKILGARGAAPVQPAGPAAAAAKVRGNTWVQPLPDRRAAAAVSHTALKKELAAHAAHRRELSTAIAKGALRPQAIVLPAKKRPKGKVAK
jgi:hypothetical protein